VWANDASASATATAIAIAIAIALDKGLAAHSKDQQPSSKP
jgi:hypothetical protein